MDERGKAFLTWLEDHRDGALANDCGHWFPQITRAVGETNGAGKLVITLNVALKKDSEDEVAVVDKAQPTIPENRADTYFIDPDTGELIRRRPRRPKPQDPNQTDLLVTDAPDLDTGPDGDSTWGGRRPYADD